MIINPINKDYVSGSSFREQLSLLYYGGSTNDSILLIRSFISIGTAGNVSFAGIYDDSKKWAEIDKLIDQGSVRGTFHTHPYGIFYFSEMDLSVQSGLAKSNGSKMLWHGISSADESKFVAVQMLNGVIFTYDYGYIKDDLDNPIIVLPRVCPIEFNKSMGFVINCKNSNMKGL